LIMSEVPLCATELDLDAVRRRVSHLDLGPGGWESLSMLLPRAAMGVLVYGSRARGDHAGDSDLDVLVIVDTPRESVASARVSLSFYTPDQLLRSSGTMFGFHLAQDAVIAHDAGRWTEGTLEMLRVPDPSRVMHRIGHLGVILDVAAYEGSDAYLVGRIRLARYLLRSALYARSIESGSPCFSVRQLADAAGEPGLIALLAADEPPTGEDGRVMLHQLESSLLGMVNRPPGEPPYRSLAELVLTEWDHDRDRAALAALVLGADADAFDYAQLPRVML
jgi:hypothetical protein